MSFEIPNRWVVLRVERERSALRVSARDDRGRQRLDLAQGGIVGRTVHFTAPPAIVKLIEEALADLPLRREPPHGTDPISLPLFLELGPRLRKEADTADPELPKELAERVQTVELAARRGGRRRPFRLPLTVLEVKSGRRAAPAAAAWHKDTKALRRDGLRLGSTPPTPPEIREALRSEARDIVIAAAQELPQVIDEMGRLSASRDRPRFLVGIYGPAERELKLSLANRLPPGIALLWVSVKLAATPGFLRELFFGVIHDHPLHDALRVAGLRRAKPWNEDAVLIADPWSNQSLRLSEVAASISDAAVALSATSPQSVRALSKWLRALEASSSQGRSSTTLISSQQVRRARTLSLGMEKHLARVRSVQAGFGRETSGLVPLARAEKSLAQARDLRAELGKVLLPTLSSPEVAAEIRKRQERRVDVALQSLESVPVEAVKPDSTLRHSGLYRLRVYVGHRSEESLMTGELPPLDPLLPPTPHRKGHLLDVVVYEKDFALLTPRVQTLQLPDLGGSEPVYFDLRAPAHPGKARLRVKVYHRNQLLQSFLLEAVIAGQERRVESPSPALRVDLVYSRTARFTNLKAFKARALSIGVNQDPEGGSHLFMFKVGKAAEAIDLSEKILDEQIGKFRKLLLGATVDAKGKPRFPTSLSPAAPPGEAFYQVIRDLADAGSDLYDALLGRMSWGLKQRFREVARNEGWTLQVVRDDPSYVFPWTILYDFGLPETVVGGPLPPVCLGSEAGKPCAHGPGDDVYCVRGFWGIRHVLEVLLAHGGVTEDELTSVERETREGAVCLAAGAQDGPTKELVAEMRKRLGTGLQVIDESEDVLDLLWDEQRRPALLIVLGHLETNEIVGEPPGPRIVLAPKKRWLRAKSITAREKKAGEWGRQPRSVILLMACGAAATEIGTLNDFVISLSSAGAAAVVGTECLVFTRLVALFAQEVTGELWGGQVTLGEAIRNLRRRLVDAGNPLAFVFSAAGNADLVFHLKE